MLGSAAGRDHGVWSKKAPQFTRNPDQGGEDRDEYQSANEVSERSHNGEHYGREERVGLNDGMNHERRDATNRGDEREEHRGRDKIVVAIEREGCKQDGDGDGELDAAQPCDKIQLMRSCEIMGEKSQSHGGGIANHHMGQSRC